ncbi:MAG: UDP-N-acetylglucosamine 2-epimerase (non-hydrolyzing) [Bacteroidota bacterium]
MKKIISVVGTRPNFIKIAPIIRALKPYRDQFTHCLCHTGQHFDEKMSTVFFDELEMPKPDFYLGINQGSHAVQTAGIMVEFEKVLLREKPDLVIVPGDVNSTMACSLAAAKLSVKIAHVESGLRSFDRDMPEEVNRIITDVISDYLFVTEESGLKNLKNEGVDPGKIFFTGNTMIDSLVYFKEKINRSSTLESLGLEEGKYILVTFHRPSNVDNDAGLTEIIAFLNNLAEHHKVVFPIHPRTRTNLQKLPASGALNPNLVLLNPLGYFDFLKLIGHAKLVITDSGGIQEETTFLGVPCVTVRNNTERPSTVDVGTNILAGTNLVNVSVIVQNILQGNKKQGTLPELWDGHAADRVVAILSKQLATR